MNQFQHGDVMGLRINKIPKGAKPVKARAGRLILADGEVTGHAHAIVADPEVELYEDDSGTLYLRCDEQKTLTHEEHGPITVEPGLYEIGIVVEVDPFADEIRRVAD